MVRFLMLVNQLICKFSTSVQDIVAEVFPVTASTVFSMSPTDAALSGSGTNTEVWRHQSNENLYLLCSLIRWALSWYIILYCVVCFLRLMHSDDVSNYSKNCWQEFRELQELQKSFYTFLHVITMHGLSSVFLSPKGRGYLDQLMQLLLHTSCNHRDILVRKVCFEFLIILLSCICSIFWNFEKFKGVIREDEKASSSSLLWGPKCCF